jgi:hypothetical protein
MPIGTPRINFAQGGMKIVNWLVARQQQWLFARRVMR